MDVRVTVEIINGFHRVQGGCMKNKRKIECEECKRVRNHMPYLFILIFFTGSLFGAIIGVLLCQ